MSQENHRVQLQNAPRCVFQKYSHGPKGLPAKWLFPCWPRKYQYVCLLTLTYLSLDTDLNLNADDGSLRNSPGPHPGHSIVIQLFLDRPTQINIYSCLQVRGLNEPRGRWQWINYSVYPCVHGERFNKAGQEWTDRIFESWHLLIL